MAGIVNGAAGKVSTRGGAVAAPLDTELCWGAISLKVATSISPEAPAWVYTSAKYPSGNLGVSASARLTVQVAWKDSQ
jgi:hypothetical protein